jgi:hypothetical protein
LGLDIYGTLLKKARKNASESLTIKEADKLANKRAKDTIKRFAKRELSRLEHTDAEGYVDAYNDIFKKKMPKYTKYTFTYEHMLPEVKPIEEVKEFFDTFIKRYYNESDVYFRKVNFVYRFFEHKLEEECCFVTRAEMEDLVERCKKVLADHSLAEELLPTRSGFFFGSTDYDDWYFEDVKSCKNQFSKILKKFNEDTDVFYMVFSW